MQKELSMNILKLIGAGTNAVDIIADSLSVQDLYRAGQITKEEAGACSIQREFALRLLRRMETEGLIEFIDRGHVVLTEKGVESVRSTNRA